MGQYQGKVVSLRASDILHFHIQMIYSVSGTSRVPRDIISAFILNILTFKTPLTARKTLWRSGKTTLQVSVRYDCCSRMYIFMYSCSPFEVSTLLRWAKYLSIPCKEVQLSWLWTIILSLEFHPLTMEAHSPRNNCLWLVLEATLRGHCAESSLCHVQLLEG